MHSLMQKHHIIPFHEWKRKINSKATRSDKNFNAPDNVVYLTLSQHAECHKWLWERYDTLEDKLAYEMLSGLIGKDQFFREKCMLGGSRSGTKKVGVPRPKWVRKKLSKASVGNMSRALVWNVTSPENQALIVQNLKLFCRNNGIHYGAFHSAVKRKASYKGFTATPVA